jgi:hypothetical protein
MATFVNTLAATDTICMNRTTGQRGSENTIFILVLTYIIPLIILSITYSVVSFLLWKRISPGNRDHFRDFLQWRSKIKVRKNPWPFNDKLVANN